MAAMQMQQAAAYSERVPGTLEEFYVPPGKVPLKPSEPEVNFVWYAPSLDVATLDGYVVLLWCSTTRKAEVKPEVPTGGGGKGERERDRGERERERERERVRERERERERERVVPGRLTQTAGLRLIPRAPLRAIYLKCA